MKSNGERVFTLLRALVSLSLSLSDSVLLDQDVSERYMQRAASSREGERERRGVNETTNGGEVIHALEEEEKKKQNRVKAIIRASLLSQTRERTDVSRPSFSLSSNTWAREKLTYQVIRTFCQLKTQALRWKTWLFQSPFCSNK